MGQIMRFKIASAPDSLVYVVDLVMLVSVNLDCKIVMAFKGLFSNFLVSKG